MVALRPETTAILSSTLDYPGVAPNAARRRGLCFEISVKTRAGWARPTETQRPALHIPVGWPIALPSALAVRAHAQRHPIPDVRKTDDSPSLQMQCPIWDFRYMPSAGPGAPCQQALPERWLPELWLRPAPRHTESTHPATVKVRLACTPPVRMHPACLHAQGIDVRPLGGHDTAFAYLRQQGTRLFCRNKAPQGPTMLTDPKWPSRHGAHRARARARACTVRTCTCTVHTGHFGKIGVWPLGVSQHGGATILQNTGLATWGQSAWWGHNSAK